MDTENYTTILLLERKGIEEKICSLNEEKLLLENKLYELEKTIYKNCDHQWEYEPRQMYERTTRRCKICYSMA